MNEDNRTETKRRPVFYVPEPNPLMGGNLDITINPSMAHDLCELLEQTDLDEDKERHLHAFGKQIRRHFGIRKARAQERSATFAFTD